MCGLKTLCDAVDLRNRIFRAFEEAERATDPALRDEWLTFVVVGGGPTRVEISGQLAIVARQTMKKDFRRIDPRAARGWRAVHRLQQGWAAVSQRSW
jgi:NADH dehydrogenase